VTEIALLQKVPLTAKTGHYPIAETATAQNASLAVVLLNLTFGAS